MKYFSIISLIFLSLFTGCENEEIIDSTTSYNEKLVVQSELIANSIFPGVRLTKTLPLGIPWNIQNAEVKDATLYLRKNGVQIIPLHYNTEGIYEPLNNFTLLENEVYELFGERDKQSFYAKTIIPRTPIVNSTNFNFSGKYLEAIVRSFEHEVYAAIWIITSGNNISADNFYSISVPEIISETSTINVRSSSLPDEYLASTYNSRRAIQVFSFDHSFNDYFNTSAEGEAINNPYVKGTGNTIWNIQGNKVIGMFIGYNKSDVLIVN
jgi:hypothetical protein